jgi:sugar phosphate isomerase/epimerase
MWKTHPNNQSQEAWEDIIESMKTALKSAEKHDVIIAVETEASNVIDTPEKARKLLDVMNNKHLKIIMDGANLFHPGQNKQMNEILEKSFALLGKDIVLAHAKDLADKEELSFVAAGEGILNFELYAKLLKEYQYDGPLIMHGLSPEQVPGSIGYLKGVL